MLRLRLLLYTARTMVDLAVFSALLAGLLHIMLDKGVRTFEAPPIQAAPGMIVAEAPQETVRLRHDDLKRVYVADSHTALQVPADATTTNDTAVHNLLEDGYVWYVPFGTQATLVHTTYTTAQVRFPDGTRGWVVREATRIN